MDPLGPFGAKEASEGALHGFPPALTNAILDAIGMRLTRVAGHARPRVRCAAQRAPRTAPAGAARWAEDRRQPHGRRGILIMSMLPAFDLQRPTSLAEAFALLAEPGARALAGGTDLVPNLRRGLEQPAARRPVRAARVRRAHARRDRLAARRRRDAGPAGSERRSGLAPPGAGGGCARRSPARATAAWPRWAATCARTPAASSTTRAHGGAQRTATASSAVATPAMWRRRASAATPPSAATWRRRCWRSTPRSNWSARGTRRLPLAELYRDDGAAHLTLAAG